MAPFRSEMEGGQASLVGRLHISLRPQKRVRHLCMPPLRSKVEEGQASLSCGVTTLSCGVMTGIPMAEHLLKYFHKPHFGRTVQGGRSVIFPAEFKVGTFNLLGTRAS